MSGPSSAGSVLWRDYVWLGRLLANSICDPARVTSGVTRIEGEAFHLSPHLGPLTRLLPHQAVTKDTHLIW